MWFRRKRKPEPERDPAETMRALREQALHVAARDVGVEPTAARPDVWGVLMETGYPTAVATLVALSDGTTSLYFSNGGGVIGAGAHATVRGTAERFLDAAEAHVAAFARTADQALPGVGRVRFHVRTFDGTLGLDADEQDLGHGRHPVSAVFHAGHALITAVREATERPGA